MRVRAYGCPGAVHKLIDSKECALKAEIVLSCPNVQTLFDWVLNHTEMTQGTLTLGFAPTNCTVTVSPAEYVVLFTSTKTSPNLLKPARSTMTGLYT